MAIRWPNKIATLMRRYARTYPMQTTGRRRRAEIAIRQISIIRRIEQEMRDRFPECFGEGEEAFDAVHIARLEKHIRTFLENHTPGRNRRSGLRNLTPGTKAVTRSVHTHNAKSTNTIHPRKSNPKTSPDRRPTQYGAAAGIRRPRDNTPESDMEFFNMFPPGYWDKETDPVAGPSGVPRGDTPTRQSDPVVAASEPNSSPPPAFRDTSPPPTSEPSPPHSPPRRIGFASVVTPRRGGASRSRNLFLRSIVKTGTLDRNQAASSTQSAGLGPLAMRSTPPTPTVSSPGSPPPIPLAAIQDDATTRQHPASPSPLASRFSTPSIATTSAAMARLGFHTDQAIDPEDLRAMAAILYQNGMVQRDPNDGLRFTPSRESSVLRTREHSLPALPPSFLSAFVTNADSQGEIQRGDGELRE
ncbi:hypothetical protein BDV93DRAFT_608530 [Ceratobasidium sp. AG-I]|nr:hypothetical protein BDV93DRAFT_608530 [Ceratobasidium sp. AG-I]